MRSSGSSIRSKWMGGVVIAKKLQDLMADWIEKSWLEKLNSSLGKPSLPSSITL